MIVWAEIELTLSEAEIAQAGGDLEQAVQNEVGHTGALVTQVLDHTGD